MHYKRIQRRAKQPLNEIMNAETREAAVEAMDVFDREYGAKYPTAVASLRRDEEKLLKGETSSRLMAAAAGVECCARDFH